MRFMFSKNILSILFFVFLFLLPKQGLSFDDNPMRPLATEKLSRPIKLTNCNGLKIIEWRATPGKEDTTSPNQKSISIINSICKLVFSEYPHFIQDEGFTVYEGYAGATKGLSACMMPADISDHGLDPRNLNDNFGRFKHRYVQESDYVWGYYDKKLKTIFMANDPLLESGEVNEMFQTIFAHELYHMISDYTGISSEVGFTEEELMARKFTDYIGL